MGPGQVRDTAGSETAHVSGGPANRGSPSFLLVPFQPDHPLTVSALLQLKGDVKETYKVLLVAQVVTGP